MKTLQLTHSKHIVSYARFLTKAGEPVGRLIRQAGLPGGCLNDPKTPVPTAALWRFRELAANRTGLPNLTLNVMADSEFTELGPIADAVLRAPTLLKMVQVFQRLVRTESSTAILQIQPCDCGGIYFVNRLALRRLQGEWHAELYVLLWMLKLVRLVDPTWSPTEVWCSSKPTPDRVQAIESLGATPRFGQCCTAIPIPASMLALSQNSSESSRRNPSIEEEHLWSMAPSDSSSGALKQVIRAYACDGWLTVKEACDATGTRLRTMQRRLSAEGKTYSDLLEETRAEMARELLEYTEATMSEIAEQLGYSEQSSFTRAFHRWASVSPTEFRAGLRRTRRS